MEIHTMGATVTTRKLAAAFKAPSGQNVYVLFEESYEKNCTPHTPEWNCILFGDLSAAMERIFRHASACEGGMLQRRGGSLTPEGYIRGWLKELASPVSFPKEAVTLKIGQQGLYDALPETAWPEVSERLRTIGRTDLRDRLAANEAIEISTCDTAVIVALYGRNGLLPPWRVLRHAPSSTARRPDLGYAPEPAKTFAVEVPEVLAIGNDERLLKRIDGTWYSAGWAYSIVGSFVSDLWQTEMRDPGSYSKRIKAYREAVNNAPQVPLENVTVVVDCTLTLDDKYKSRSVAELRSNPGAVRTANGFEIIPTKDLLWSLTQLPQECTSWIIPPEALPIV
jgi:hypothetical protein